MMKNLTKPKIYFAGRISKSKNRFGKCDSSIYDSDLLYCENIPPVEHKEFIYTGPFTFADDHGCNHRGLDRFFNGTGDAEWMGTAGDFFGTRSHGATYDCGRNGELLNQSIRRAVFERSLNGIRNADRVFAWIEDEECFGTLVELGYAKALGKPIHIGIAPHIDVRGELWFALYAAEWIERHSNAAEAVESFLDRLAGIPKFLQE